MKHLFISFLITLGFTQIVSANTVEISSDEEIATIVSQFSEYTKEKDEEKFLDLLYTPQVTWLEVSPGERTGTLPSQIGVNHPKNYYINRAFNSETKIELDISNLVIHTDGDVASAYFSKKLSADGVIDKTGDMGIHFIKTLNGWKITSIIQSTMEAAVSKNQRSHAKHNILSVMAVSRDAELKKDESRYFEHILDASITSIAIVPLDRTGQSTATNGVSAWNHSDGWKWGRLATDKPSTSDEWDIHIETDGDIASASNKYRYMVDGKIANWGYVTRHFIRVNNTWKMVSHIFSATNNSNDPREKP